jgi:hypothetical protein
MLRGFFDFYIWRRWWWRRRRRRRRRRRWRRSDGINMKRCNKPNFKNDKLNVGNTLRRIDPLLSGDSLNRDSFSATAQ